MGLFDFWKPQPFVTTRELSANPHLFAAAELIDDRIGKTKDGVVTKKDLVKTRELLAKHDEYVAKGKNEKSPLAKMMRVEIDVVRAALDKLEAALHDKKPEVGNRVYCTSLSVDAIHDKAAKRTAAFLAANVGNGSKQLNLKEVDDVRSALNARAAGSVTQDQAALLATIDAGAASGEFDAEALKHIELYMFTGKGGLVQHGPVTIAGRRFDDVYRLPIPDSVDFTKPEEKAALLDDYERRFKDCGYDRIYIRNDQGELFVALNSKGKLKRIDEGLRAQFREDGELKDSAEVVRVQDVDNSFGEAVFGFWGRLARRLLSAIRGRPTDAETAQAIAAATDKFSETGKKAALGQLLVAGSMVSTVGIATFNAPVALGLGVVTTIGATVANLVLMSQLGQSKLTVEAGAGITVNRQDV